MNPLSYAGAPAAVREDIRAAHERFFARLAAPGTWFTGAARVSIAAEARAADACRACAARKAGAPARLAGEHDATGLVAGGKVEVIHRVRTDPGGPERRVYEKALASGSSDAEYVEIVGIVVQLTSVDSFCKAIGVPLHSLPEPRVGSPSRRRPAGAKPGSAWVPWVEASDAVGPESDLYGGRPYAPNVGKALSLVPDEVRGMRDLADAQYVPMGKVVDVSFRRTLTRAQMELVAGRVSALNQCFYCTTAHALLLRASGDESGDTYHLRGLAAPEVGETGVAHGALLLEFADAALGSDESALAEVRRQVADELGPEALVDACAVVATFQQMNRIANATGIPLDGVMELTSARIRAEIGLERFASAGNTPRTFLRKIAATILSPLRAYLYRMRRRRMK